MSLLTALRAALLPAGLNLVAALPVDRYDRDVPEAYRLRKRSPAARSIVVIGNGGGEFWRGFQRFCSEHPGFFDRSDPLDEYTARIVERLVAPLMAGGHLTGRIVYPFQFEAEPVSFVHLGMLAGMGSRSVLGVLVHPEYGPWIALRAAIVLDDEIEPTAVIPFDPCGTCADKACSAACPASAVGDHGWDIPGCTAHRVEREADCTDRCHARWHCVYGQAHRYPSDALAYHQRRARAVMRMHHGS